MAVCRVGWVWIWRPVRWRRGPAMRIETCGKAVRSVRLDPTVGKRWIGIDVRLRMVGRDTHSRDRGAVCARRGLADRGLVDAQRPRTPIVGHTFPRMNQKRWMINEVEQVITVRCSSRPVRAETPSTQVKRQIGTCERLHRDDLVGLRRGDRSVQPQGPRAGRATMLPRHAQAHRGTTSQDRPRG